MNYKNIYSDNDSSEKYLQYCILYLSNEMQANLFFKKTCRIQIIMTNNNNLTWLIINNGKQ